MSFLQPLLLAALPLVALPIIIHLLNRRRHRTVRWGAMMFLLSATRESNRKQRLRHLLIMAARMLTIAGLILAVSRPLSSGLLGMFGSTPDTVIVLLDRSASMGQQDLQSQRSKRSVAVQQVTDTLRTTGAPDNLVLIDSATRRAQVIPRVDQLAELPDVAATDGASDVPSMLEVARQYIVANKSGRTDIWICSDLQQSDWNAESGQWSALRDGFSELKQGIRFHLLTYARRPADNVSVRIDALRRLASSDGHNLSLDVQIQRDTASQPLDIPVAVVVNGARSVVDARLDGESFVIDDHRVEIDSARPAGWGKVELPNDSHPRDNVFYFTYGEAPLLRAAIVSSQPSLIRTASLAIAPPLESVDSVVSVVPIDEFGTIDLHQTAMVIWHAPLPSRGTADRLREFVDVGGVLLFYPPGEDVDSEELFGIRWGPWRRAPDSDPFLLSNWRDDRGLLRNTDSGGALSVNELSVLQYRSIEGAGQKLASFVDGAALLLQAATERGSVYFCTTLPDPAYSNLGKQGVVQFAMLQRALAAGADRLANAQQTDVGEAIALRPSEKSWRQLDGWREGNLSTAAELCRWRIWHRYPIGG